MERLILKLVENQTVMSAITLVITTACGLGVAYLTHKREQLIELSKGALVFVQNIFKSITHVTLLFKKSGK